MKLWYNFRNGGYVPPLRRNEGGNTPNVQTGIPQGGYARPAWDAYVAGTNPYGYDYSQFQTVNYKPSAHTFKDYYTPPEPVVETAPADDSPVDTTPVYTGPVDEAGTPAPYLGVDPYDPEGDDNFLTQDEQAVLTQTIADEFDSIDSYDPTKTFEEQLSEDDYAAWSQTDATADNYMSMSNPAVEAADTLYNNNQQIYGEETGNNVTSLVTGQTTGLDDAGVAELVNADPGTTWEQDTNPVEEMINQQVVDWQEQAPEVPIELTPPPAEPVIDTSTFETHTPTDTSATDTWSGDSHPAFELTPEESAAKAGFDMNDPSTWKDPNEDSGGIIDTVTDTVKDTFTGGGDDGVGNFGAVGDFFGGIGDALGITDYSGQAEAKAAEEAAAAKAAEEAAAAKAAADAQVAAEAERQRQAQAALEAQQEQARRQAELEAAAAKAAQEEAARKAAEEEAARKAQEEADRKANEARANADMDKVRAAQDRLAAGEIDFVTYLQEAGLQDAFTSSMGIQTGLGAAGSAGSMGNQTIVHDNGYVESDGPVNTKTGQHTVENEMDGQTAVDNYNAVKNSRNNDDPHMTHAEIIEYHNSLEKAETDLIQSDLSDDEFWNAYDDDDGGGGGNDSSAGGATVICTALRDLGLIDRRTWRHAELWAARKIDATTYYGYLHWATPIANGMREGKHGFFRWAGVCWAHQMAHEVTGGREGKHTTVGWLACRIGSAFSKLIGLTLGGEYAKSKST